MDDPNIIMALSIFRRKKSPHTFAQAERDIFEWIPASIEPVTDTSFGVLSKKPLGSIDSAL